MPMGEFLHESLSEFLVISVEKLELCLKSFFEEFSLNSSPKDLREFSEESCENLRLVFHGNLCCNYQSNFWINHWRSFLRNF